jgi:hypothetical protein
MPWSERIIIPHVTRELFRHRLDSLRNHIWSLAVYDIEALKRAARRFDEPLDPEMVNWLEANQEQMKKLSIVAGKLAKLPEHLK